jgi:ABC-2 type transport system permease protein
VSIGAVDPAATEPGLAPAVDESPSPTARVTRATERTMTVVNGDLRLGPRIRALWDNRELLLLFIRTELKVKYKGSVLGFLWSMLNPAMVLGIYWAAFSVIDRGGGIPRFVIWLFAGLLAWNLFNNSAMTATTVVVGQAGIVKKVAFPRELLALSTVGVAAFLFVIQVGVLVIVMAALGMTPAWAYLADMPLAIVDLVVFTSAAAIFLSAVNVYFRDTQHLTEVALMAWFWGTPVVYAYGSIASLVARHPSILFLKYLYVCNPLTPIVMTFQRAIYGTASYVSPAAGNSAHVATTLLPNLSVGGYALGLVILLVASVAAFLGALVVFGRLEGNFAEEL